MKSKEAEERLVQSNAWQAHAAASDAELDSVRADRQRLREHSTRLAVQVQELSDALRVAESRERGGGGSIDSVASVVGSARSAELPAYFYDELARVESALSSERRVNSELEKECRNYRRLLLAREKEILSAHERLERESERPPALAAAEQRVDAAERRADKLEVENQTLLAVQRAKTGAIERLSEQLQTLAETLARAQQMAGRAATLEQQLDATSLALQTAEAKVAQLQRAIEKLEARPVGIPPALWKSERQAMLGRQRAAEERAAKAEESAALAARGARQWAARWRALAALACKPSGSASFAQLRALVTKQRNASKLIVRGEETYSSPKQARETMRKILLGGE